MNVSRIAVYIGGASLLAAWLSSADSLAPRHQDAPAGAGVEPIDPADSLVADVQGDVERLRKRIAAAPAPQRPLRNPFSFAVREPAPARQTVPTAGMWPAVAAAAETGMDDPPLSLLGFAEHRRAEGLIRTAMIVTGSDDLLLAVVGDTLLQRYTVTRVDTDRVELSDTLTGRSRRLVLE